MMRTLALVRRWCARRLLYDATPPGSSRARGLESRASASDHRIPPPASPPPDREPANQIFAAFRH